MARVMLHSKALPPFFLQEAINTVCHIHNQISLCPGTTFTNYQLWKVQKPNVKYFHIFGSKCHILNDREYHKTWDFKSDKEIFLGYSTNSRVFHVYNKWTQTVIEFINVIVHDSEDLHQSKVDDEDAGQPTQKTSSTNEASEAQVVIMQKETLLVCL